MYHRVIKGIQNRLKSRRLYNRNREILDRNIALKNKFAGKRCFIIANGPSIRNQNLTKLTNEETFVVNSFWLHPQYYRIKPKNYVLVDADAFPPDRPAYCKDEFLGRAKELTSLPTRFFFNSGSREVISAYKEFSEKEVYYLGLAGYFDEKLKFNTDLTRLIPNVKNVVIGSIIIAAYMGFEEIYLLGCDHDFLAHPFPNHNLSHFVELPNHNLKDPAALNYYAVGTGGSYEGLIDAIKILFKGYRLLKTKLALTHPNLKIYNATPNGFLDVFPMVKYEEII